MPEKNIYSLYQYALENIQDIVWELDPGLNFTFVSPNCKGLTGYDDCELIGHRLTEFLSEESKDRILAEWQEMLQERVSSGFKKIILYDVEFIRRDGKALWYEVSVKPVFNEKRFIGYIGTSRDVTEKKAHELELKKYIAELEYTNRKLDQLATFDILTGAYNRRKFEEFVALSAEKSHKQGIPFSIVMFDVDCFKLINDNWGHKAGDMVLQELCLIIRGILPERQKLFRWGGDEFIILLQESDLKQAYCAAEEVRNAVAEHDFGEEKRKISISLGVGEYRRGLNVDQFLSNVDKALLSAKANGKNRTEGSIANLYY